MERDVLNFLKSSPGQFYSSKEVGKKVDRKQFVENPNWARPFLQKLLEKNLIEQRGDGYYFYPKNSRDD